MRFFILICVHARLSFFSSNVLSFADRPRMEQLGSLDSAELTSEDEADSGNDDGPEPLADHLILDYCSKCKNGKPGVSKGYCCSDGTCSGITSLGCTRTAGYGECKKDINACAKHNAFCEQGRGKNATAENSCYKLALGSRGCTITEQCEQGACADFVAGIGTCRPTCARDADCTDRGCFCGKHRFESLTADQRKQHCESEGMCKGRMGDTCSEELGGEHPQCGEGVCHGIGPNQVYGICTTRAGNPCPSSSIPDTCIEKCKSHASSEDPDYPCPCDFCEGGHCMRIGNEDGTEKSVCACGTDGNELLPRGTEVRVKLEGDVVDATIRRNCDTCLCCKFNYDATSEYKIEYQDKFYHVKPTAILQIKTCGPPQELRCQGDGGEEDCDEDEYHI